jgi:hypothetical protein
MPIPPSAAPPNFPNVPAAPSLSQTAPGSLAVNWSAPETDPTHAAATGYALRSSPAGAGIWTVVSPAVSPSILTGLQQGAPIDVQVQGINAAGASAWSPSSTLAPAPAGPFAPNAPAAPGAAPPPDGTVTRLTVTWNAPASDLTHDAATGYNLRYSPAGAGIWTMLGDVSSPTTVTGLTGATTFDVQVQATNAAATPSAWSIAATASTWGAAVTPGNWVAAATQTVGAGVAPFGGVNLTAVAAPSPVTGAAFAWSSNAFAVPAIGLIPAGGDGQPNGWGQWFSAPATAGITYLWLLAQGAGGTIGALVTSAIRVSAPNERDD